ncbi:hypothetical protein LCGC14_0404960 [marine sediment metagenome]|uniref:Uncharacterized protein n=1 Tax=marine sediment metagenome TaxID=412755 RepID=A0A0F9HAX6_9ZZZZ
MAKLEFNDKADKNTIKLKKNEMDPFQILDVYQSINSNFLNDFNELSNDISRKRTNSEIINLKT